MVIPKTELKSITDSNYETTQYYSALDLFKYMHFYYVVGDVKAANAIREWLVDKGYVIHISREDRIMQIHKGVSAAVYNYSMEDVDLICISCTDISGLKERIK